MRDRLALPLCLVGCLGLVACEPSPGALHDSALQDSALPEGTPLPSHNECRAETIPEEVCLAVVEEDGKQPTVSEQKSGLLPDATDPRQNDPELNWLRGEIGRCACACCHSRSLGGPGVYHWDLEWSPVWIDSASSWTLGVLRGDTENPDRTLLPGASLEDKARVEAILSAEVERRREDDGD